MKFKKTAVKYCVELTIPEFEAIMEKEKDCENDGTWYTLCGDLEHIQGIDEVDYNGHFGANIFYTNDLEYPVDRKVIEKIIEKWTKGYKGE